jgi:outer membrane protein assembly factor BamE (lipoprotein component of BamABCDE complex)
MNSSTESTGQFAGKFYRNLAGSIALAGWVQLIVGCARFQPTTPSLNFSPTSETQSVTMKDTSIHYDPSVMRPGVDRSEVEQTFGEPNSSDSLKTGQTEDVYAFYPDGTKFVNPTVRPRNIALGVFTGGMSVAVRQLRIHQAESKLTLYHVIYDANGTVASVHIEPPAGGGAAAPVQAQSQSQSTIGSGAE